MSSRRFAHTADRSFLNRVARTYQRDDAAIVRYHFAIEQ